jgi:uncharacterized protein (DUF486 family)
MTRLATAGKSHELPQVRNLDFRFHYRSERCPGGCSVLQFRNCSVRGLRPQFRRQPSVWTERTIVDRRTTRLSTDATLRETLVLVIFVSWGLALIEYYMAVPANRFGAAIFSPAQLKTIQEVITLVVFAIFSTVYLKNPPTWVQGLGFSPIAAGAFFVFQVPK